MSAGAEKKDHNLSKFFGTIGLGCMGLSGTYGAGLTNDKFTDFIKGAYDLGVRVFDTADVYGRSADTIYSPEELKTMGHNEIMLGKAIRESGIPRDEICIATKCGFVPGWTLDLSATHIKKACEDSLTNLGMDQIDIFYLHRLPTTLEGLDACLEVLAALVLEKKIRFIGLSEASPEYIRHAHTYFAGLMKKGPENFPYNPLGAVETEFSIFSPGPLREGGVMQTCAELGILFSPYASLGRGLLTDSITACTFNSHGDTRFLFDRFQEPNLSKNLALRDQFAIIAREVGCSLAQLALAWSIKKANDLKAAIPSITEEVNCPIVLIPGTTRLERVKENLTALDFVEKLTPEIMARIDAVAPYGAHGNRYPEWARKLQQIPDSPTAREAAAFFGEFSSAVPENVAPASPLN